MANKINQSETVSSAEALRRNYVKPGSPEHVRMLEVGYQMTLDDAKIIVDEWNKDHRTWPLEEVKKARAMIEAAKATPKVVDPDPGWKRDRSY